MKSFMLLISSLLSLFAFAQEKLPLNQGGKIYFAEEVKVDSSTAEELYRSAKTWMLENFTNLKQILKKDDRSSHEIIIRGSGECYPLHAFGDTIENKDQSYTLTIQTLDGMYKYSITDFVTSDKWKGDIPSEELKGSRKQVQEHEQTIGELAATLAASLKKAMASHISVNSE